MWLVFWVYNILVGFLLNLLFVWLLHREMAFASLALAIFFLFYSVWILVAIWRCAANSMALWCLLARLIVILGVIWMVRGAIEAFA